MGGEQHRARSAASRSGVGLARLSLCPFDRRPPVCPHSGPDEDQHSGDKGEQRGGVVPHKHEHGRDHDQEGGDGVLDSEGVVAEREEQERNAEYPPDSPHQHRVDPPTSTNACCYKDRPRLQVGSNLIRVKSKPSRGTERCSELGLAKPTIESALPPTKMRLAPRKKAECSEKSCFANKVPSKESTAKMSLPVCSSCAKPANIGVSWSTLLALIEKAKYRPNSLPKRRPTTSRSRRRAAAATPPPAADPRCCRPAAPASGRTTAARTEPPTRGSAAGPRRTTCRTPATTCPTPSPP